LLLIGSAATELKPLNCPSPLPSVPQLART
jgi:hypothetical protein